MAAQAHTSGPKQFTITILYIALALYISSENPPPPSPNRSGHAAKILHDDKLCKIFAINLNCLAIMQRPTRCAHVWQRALSSLIFLRRRAHQHHQPPHVIRLGAKGILALYNCVRPSTISTMRSAHGGGKTAEKSVPVAVCVCRFPLADRLTTGRRRFQFA